MSFQTTTWQTIGPFFRIGLERLYTNDIAAGSLMGERVAVDGRVIDGAGMPIPDAVIEIWQANSNGKYAHPEDTQEKPMEKGFRGFGRIPTNKDGCFYFTTIKPGCVPGPNGKMQAPHLVVGILMRGLLKGLVTRAYFPDDELLASDPILKLVDPGRRSTLILERSAEHGNLLHWEIRMQGECETVFFDF